MRHSEEDRAWQARLQPASGELEDLVDGAAGGGTGFGGLAEAEEDLGEAGTVDESGETAAKRRDFDGLVVEAGMDAIDAGLEEDVGEGLAGSEPVAECVVGCADDAEQGGAVDEVGVLVTGGGATVVEANPERRDAGGEAV